MNSEDKPTDLPQQVNTEPPVASTLQAESGPAVYRTLRSSPLVVSLVVVLMAAVLLQGAILVGIYTIGMQEQAEGKFQTTPPAEEALENGILSINGEKETPNERKDQNGRVVENSRSVSQFQPSFNVPADTDPAGMTTNYEGDTLTIKIPKK